MRFVNGRNSISQRRSPLRGAKGCGQWIYEAPDRITCLGGNESCIINLSSIHLIEPWINVLMLPSSLNWLIDNGSALVHHQKITLHQNKVVCEGCFFLGQRKNKAETPDNKTPDLYGLSGELPLNSSHSNFQQPSELLCVLFVILRTYRVYSTILSRCSHNKAHL